MKKDESMVMLGHGQSVTLISSYYAIEPEDNLDKAFVEVNRPHIEQEYNTFIKGVDLLDASIAPLKVQVPNEVKEVVPLPVLANHHVRPC